MVVYTFSLVLFTSNPTVPRSCDLDIPVKSYDCPKFWAFGPGPTSRISKSVSHIQILTADSCFWASKTLGNVLLKNFAKTFSLRIPHVWILQISPLKSSWKKIPCFKNQLGSEAENGIFQTYPKNCQKMFFIARNSFLNRFNSEKCDI